MLHLIQGDDEYRITLKRDEIVAGYLEKGDAAVEHYDGKDSNVSLNTIFQAVSTQSFFEPRKIVILDNSFDLYSREKSYLSKKGGLN